MRGMKGVSILIVTYVDCSVFNHYIAWKNNTNLELKNNEILVHTGVRMKKFKVGNAKYYKNVK